MNHQPMHVVVEGVFIQHLVFASFAPIEVQK
jgi:hypothetical protein